MHWIGLARHPVTDSLQLVAFPIAFAIVFMVCIKWTIQSVRRRCPNCRRFGYSLETKDIIFFPNDNCKYLCEYCQYVGTRPPPDCS